MLDRKLQEEIQLALLDELPLSFEYRELPDSGDGPRFEFSYGGSNRGFTIVGTIGWKSVELEFSPKTYSISIVRYLESVFAKDSINLTDAFGHLIPLRGYVQLHIDGRACAWAESSHLPPGWRSFSMKVGFGPSEIRDSSRVIRYSEVAERVHAFGLMLRSILPLEEVDDVIAQDDRLIGVPEGAKMTVLVNRFERSKANRDECIRIHGTKCAICGFDFEAIYGVLGRGYIQVHHIVPVSKLNPELPVNPETDLIPLCANCHCMVHREDPPRSADDIKKLISSKGTS